MERTSPNKFFLVYRLLSGYLPVHERKRKKVRVCIGDYYRAAAPLTYPKWIPVKRCDWLAVGEFFGARGSEPDYTDGNYYKSGEAREEIERWKNTGFTDAHGWPGGDYYNYLLFNLDAQGGVISVLHRELETVGTGKSTAPVWRNKWVTKLEILSHDYPLPARSILLRQTTDQKTFAFLTLLLRYLLALASLGGKLSRKACRRTLEHMSEVVDALVQELRGTEETSGETPKNIPRPRYQE